MVLAVGSDWKLLFLRSDQDSESNRKTIGILYVWLYPVFHVADMIFKAQTSVKIEILFQVEKIQYRQSHYQHLPWLPLRQTERLIWRNFLIF